MLSKKAHAIPCIHEILKLESATSNRHPWGYFTFTVTGFSRNMLCAWHPSAPMLDAGFSAM